MVLAVEVFGAGLLALRAVVVAALAVAGVLAAVLHLLALDVARVLL